MSERSRWMLVTVLILSWAGIASSQDQNPADKDKPPAAGAAAKPKPAPLPELNEKLIRYCRDKLGQTVGDGQCSSLALGGLMAGGGQFRFRESPSSGDYVWGSLVCRLEAANGKQDLEIGEAGKKPEGQKGADVKPGDIIQFRDVEFHGRTSRVIFEMTYPHHTAVIESISPDGSTCKVFEQNVNGKPTVAITNLPLSSLTRGWLRVYRPVARSSGTNR